MCKIIPNQSGMDFIAENTFHIEQSRLFKNIGDGVRTVELIRAKDDKLLFIEAKTSFPNPINPKTENTTRFQEEIIEVCEKFIHSLNMFSSVKSGVSEHGFHSDFIVPKKIKLVFMLIIKNHEFEWCKPIKVEIEEILPLYLKKIWKPIVYVINQEIASEQELIIN